LQPRYAGVALYEFASDWLDGLSGELAATVEVHGWQLTNHLLPFFIGQ
jgi:hypothetical protein